jgi:hypothetical protein
MQKQILIIIVYTAGSRLFLAELIALRCKEMRDIGGKNPVISHFPHMLTGNILFLSPKELFMIRIYNFLFTIKRIYFSLLKTIYYIHTYNVSIHKLLGK